MPQIIHHTHHMGVMEQVMVGFLGLVRMGVRMEATVLTEVME
jgi:hypothetical protein